MSGYLLEALLSLLVFLLLISSFIIYVPNAGYAFYSYALAEDAWKALYIRNGETMFLMPESPSVQNDVLKMNEITGICFCFGAEPLPMCSCQAKTIYLSYPVVGSVPYSLVMGK